MSEAKTLISINQAVKQGIDKIRLPIWSNADDYLKIDLIKTASGDICLGPWFHLFSPVSELVGLSNPHDILSLNFDLDEEVFEPYVVVDKSVLDRRGDLADDEEYCSQCNGTGVLGERESCYSCKDGVVKKLP